MIERNELHPLKLGDRAPNVVLDAITRDGKISIDDFRGQKPVLVGLFRGLHCAFCRRHIAAQAQLDPALREMGVESLDRRQHANRARPPVFSLSSNARSACRSRPRTRLASRISGFPILNSPRARRHGHTRSRCRAVWNMRVNVPGELPRPIDPLEASEVLNKKDGYKITESDQEMIAMGHGQLVGQFLLDRQGIVRWSFTEVPRTAEHVRTPNPQELMSAASQVVQ